MASELTWKKAIEKVLREADGAMTYKDIADRIITDGLRQKVGATPAATVSANLTTSIIKDGEKSLFQKVGRGEYILRSISSMENLKKSIVKSEIREENNQEESQYEIVSSFGMFWRRDYIDWQATPKLLGMQQIGSEPVDFHKQSGIYLLYDGRKLFMLGARQTVL